MLSKFYHWVAGLLSSPEVTPKLRPNPFALARSKPELDNDFELNCSLAYFEALLDQKEQRKQQKTEQKDLEEAYMKVMILLSTQDSSEGQQ